MFRMAATTGDRILFSLPRPALADPGRLGQIRRHLPVYVFSGTKNPVGQQLAGVSVMIGAIVQPVSPMSPTISTRVGGAKC